MNLRTLCETVHKANALWWTDINTGQPLKRNKGELLALIHSEISEAHDGFYQAVMDDKLPHRCSEEVELVDGAIRIFDYAAGFNHDLYAAALKFGISEFHSLNHLFYTANVAKLGVPTFDEIHSAISRVLELERKGHPSAEVSEALVSLLLLIFKRASLSGYDMQAAFDEKMAYNAQREDHKHEARRIAGGKQF